MRGNLRHILYLSDSPCRELNELFTVESRAPGREQVSRLAGDQVIQVTGGLYIKMVIKYFWRVVIQTPHSR
jgi:hypothetical protein